MFEKYVILLYFSLRLENNGRKIEERVLRVKKTVYCRYDENIHELSYL